MRRPRRPITGHAPARPPKTGPGRTEPGDRVLFRHRGRYIPGIVAGPGFVHRAPVQAIGSDGISRGPLYWRNRSQLYAIPVREPPPAQLRFPCVVDNFEITRHDTGETIRLGRGLVGIVKPDPDACV